MQGYNSMGIFTYNPLNDFSSLYSVIILLFGTICYLIYTNRTKNITTKPIYNKKSKLNKEKNDRVEMGSAECSIIEKFVTNYSAPVVTPYIITVSGGSGSGKTFITSLIVKTIKKMFPKSTSVGKNIVILHLDSYYKGGEEDANYDIPASIDFTLFVQHLEELIAGNPVECPIYDFASHSRIKETKTIVPGKIIVLEGILLLTDIQIRKLSNLKIFINASLSTQIFRRTKRDVKDRGRTIDEVEARYERDVEPSYHEHVFPSSRHADMFINNFNGSYVGHEVMLNHIVTILKKIYKEE